MSVTKQTAAQTVARALQAGHVLTIPCPNGDTVTAGRKADACATYPRFNALRWGRSSFALPSGLEISSDVFAPYVAAAIVEHCGRGAAARVARVALGE